MGKIYDSEIDRYVRKISLVEYSPKFKKKWDEFISESKNGTFLFYRDYMEYHSDRFRDYSLLFYYKNKLIGVMPANIEGDILYSHAGLTYGGIVSNYRMKTPIMLGIFRVLMEHLKDIGVKKLVYKPVPHIYHTIPAEEDLYALFRYNAKLIQRGVSSVIYMEERVEFDDSRKRSIRRSKKSGLEVRRSYDFKTYMRIVEENLRKKYGVKPTHTAEEIELLASRFPENIKLFAAYSNGSMVAGVIMYETKNVAHAQYIASNELGKKLYALDFLFDFLINHYYAKKTQRYFDFGISTEKGGRVLNAGLIRQKEEFGARAVVYDTYEVEV